MTIIRTPNDAINYLRAHIGDTRFPPDNITVLHHCIGIAGRTHTGRSAGYPTANDAARAVIKAGHMRPPSSSVPDGALRWWLSSDAGHVATQDRTPGRVLCNVGAKIAAVDASIYANLHYVGWSWSWDVPGWGKITDVYPGGGGGGASVPAPKPKPTRGATKVIETTIARKSPSLGAPHAGSERKPGFTVRYVAVVKGGGETWLRTRWGNFYLAKRTARGE